jgi:hypothetical protein
VGTPDPVERTHRGGTVAEVMYPRPKPPLKNPYLHPMTETEWRDQLWALEEETLMAVDFDQSGTFREYAKLWLGPSVGHITAAVFNNLLITAGGTYVLARGVTYVSVNVAASVTITLPPSGPSGNVAANPGDFITLPGHHRRRWWSRSSVSDHNQPRRW